MKFAPQQPPQDLVVEMELASLLPSVKIMVDQHQDHVLLASEFVASSSLQLQTGQSLRTAVISKTLASHPC